MNIVWAEGSAPIATSTPHWSTILTKMIQLGGRELTEGRTRGVLAFETEDARNTFAGWYAGIAPLGLKVRTVVREIEPAPDTVPVVAPPAGMTSLKELRMWHWRQMLHERILQKQRERNRRFPCPEVVELLKQRADLHLSAVQVLNDILPGTAEQDCAEEDTQG